MDEENERIDERIDERHGYCQMNLKKKKYNSGDVLRLAFEVSPVCMILYVALSVSLSVLQTAMTAVATANFVDTATAILNHARPYKDIYLALVTVLLTLGFVNTISSVAGLAASRVDISLQRCLKPAVVKILRHSIISILRMKRAGS